MKRGCILMSHFAVITGASRGLGASTAELLIEKGIGVINVSRTDNPSVKEKAQKQSVYYDHVPCDLSNPERVDEVFAEIALSLSEKSVSKLIVINNAGVVEPIEVAGKYDSSEIVNHVSVNYVAPMLITNAFIKLNQEDGMELTIVNITSGAATRPIHGWGPYGSTKAAIDRFTETVALEQKDTLVKLFAFSPGIMDTSMQKDIRSSSRDSFKDVDTFVAFKEEGKLKEPAEVATVLVKLIERRATIESGSVYHVNDVT